MSGGETVAVEQVDREAVEAIFADLRDRKFLKYLFADAQDQSCGMGAYGYINSPLDLEVQAEIAAAWANIMVRHRLAALRTADREREALAEEVRFLLARIEELDWTACPN